MRLLRFSNVPVAKFQQIFNNADVVDAEEYGFDPRFVVYRFPDVAGNPAFAIQKHGSSTVDSFGQVILDLKTAKALGDS